MRLLIEILHLISGIAGTALIAALAAWSYSLAKWDIWLVAYVAMGAVVVMYVGPLRGAWRADAEERRARRVPASESGTDG